MDTIPLTNEERKRLVGIIARLAEVRTADDRIIFLEDCGLRTLETALKFDTASRTFAAELVRLCQDKGRFTPTGEPALASILTFLRDEILQGRETEREFVSTLLQQTNPNVARASQLRRRNPDFTGRTEALERLTSALYDGRTVHLQGMGGAGKTELALQLAARVKTEFPGPGLQVELQPDNTPANAVSLLSQVIVSLNPAVRLPTTLNELQARAHSLMDGKKGILLLDNAAAPEQIHPLREVARGWAVLVTSRARFALSGSKLEVVGELTEDESKNLLAKFLDNYGRSASEEELVALAAACHRLPLPLTVAAVYLGTDITVSVSDYLTLLRDHPSSGFHVEGYEDVYKVLGLSIERLVRENPELCERWHLLAQMPAPFDADLAAALWGTLIEGQEPTVKAVDKESTSTALRELVRLGVLGYDEIASQYRLHDLWRTYATEISSFRLSDTVIGRAIQCHALTVLRRGSAAGNLYDEGQQVDALAQFDAIWEHLDGAWRALHNNTDEIANYFLGNFTVWMIKLLGLRLSPRGLITHIEISLIADRRRVDRRREGVHLGNLGNRYYDLGQIHKAIFFYEQALLIANELGDKNGKGNHLNNLGNAYSVLNTPRETLTYNEEALTIARELGDKHTESNRLGNLGNVYHALGDIQQAISYFEQALIITRNMGDIRGEARHIGNLANVYFTLGKFQDAISYYQQALIITRKMGDKYGEGVQLGNLGVIYRNLGDSWQAITFYEQALSSAREIEDKKSESRHLYNLGNIYLELEKIQEAITKHKEGLLIAQETGVKNSEGYCLLGLANDYVALENYDTALSYAHNALSIFEATENFQVAEIRAAIGIWEAARANSSKP